MYIFVKQPTEPTSSFKCYDVLQSPRTALVYPLGSRCSRWWAWARRRAHEVGTMGRNLKGPFPLGSVLCTYERPLEIQYNTIPLVAICRKEYGWSFFSTDATTFKSCLSLPLAYGYHVIVKKAYKFYNDPKTYADAKAICEAEGTALGMAKSSLDYEAHTHLMGKRDPWSLIFSEVTAEIVQWRATDSRQTIICIEGTQGELRPLNILLLITPQTDHMSNTTTRKVFRGRFYPY